jgi:hypothetical protein
MRPILVASSLSLLVCTAALGDDSASTDPATLDGSQGLRLAQYYQPVYVAPPPPRFYVYVPPPPPWIRPAHFVRPYFGLSGFGTIVLGQSGGVEYLHTGGGLGVWGGLDFGRFFGLELAYNVSFHNPVDNCETTQYTWCGANYLTVETVGLDVKFHIPTGSRFVPYAQAGVLISWIGRQGNPSDATGGGFEVGGGFDIWLNRVVTLGANAVYRGLFMSDYATFTGTGTYLDLINVGGTLGFHFY